MDRAESTPAHTLFATAAAVCLLLAGGCGDRLPSYYQGYAEGDFVRVAAPFAGSLTTLSVKAGTVVKPDDPLFVLEQANEAAARREAQERLSRAEAVLDNLKKGRRAPEIAAIRAQKQQAEASLELSQAHLKRTEHLVSVNFVSREQLDEARAAYERDRARVKELAAQLETARLAARPDEIRAAEFEAAAARAALAQAEWKLAQKSVRAPVGGVVDDTLFVQGEWVPAGLPVVSLLPPENIKVRFFVPEPELGRLKLGQAISVSCDGCGAAIPAQISFISPQAEYTPPVIYSKETRTKLVFLVEARPSPQNATRLKPGQPLDVRLQP